MKRITVVLCTVTLALSVAALGAAPGGAGSSCVGTASTAPDGRIKVDGSSFQGAGLYAETEIVKTTLAQGDTATFTMRWKNVSNAPKNIRFNILVAPVSPGFSRPRYFVGGVNITRQLPPVFRDIAPGKSTPALDVTIKNKTATSGAEILAGLEGRYGGAPFGACDALIGSIDLS